MNTLSLRSLFGVCKFEDDSLRVPVAHLPTAPVFAAATNYCLLRRRHANAHGKGPL